MSVGSVLTAAPAEAASIEMLSGKWTAVLSGNTGCGITSMYLTFGLNSAGKGNATTTSHSTGCPTGTTTGNDVIVTSLNPNGTGTMHLSCGVSCGWVFRIQVSSDYDQIIMADVEVTNPNNTPTGVAIRQFP
jgi:hypothetical protein